MAGVGVGWTGIGVWDAPNDERIFYRDQMNPREKRRGGEYDTWKTSMLTALILTIRSMSA